MHTLKKIIPAIAAMLCACSGEVKLGINSHTNDAPIVGVSSEANGFGLVKDVKRIIKERDLSIQAASAYRRVLWFVTTNSLPPNATNVLLELDSLVEEMWQTRTNL